MPRGASASGRKTQLLAYAAVVFVLVLGWQALSVRSVIQTGMNDLKSVTAKPIPPAQHQTVPKRTPLPPPPPRKRDDTPEAVPHPEEEEATPEPPPEEGETPSDSEPAGGSTTSRIGQRPPHIEKALQLHKERKVKMEGENSVGVDADDIARAEANIIKELPEVPSGYPQPVRTLLDAIRGPMQEAALDSSPIAIDFGCTAGLALSAIHDRATVVCANAAGSTIGKPLGKEVPRNFFWIAGNGPMEHPFSELYESCNLMTVALVLGVPKEIKPLIQHLAALVPAAGSTFALVPVGKIGEVKRGVAAALRDSEAKYDETVVASFPGEEVGGVVGEKNKMAILHLRLRHMSRPCRKTFGAPMEQWNRKQTVTFDDGLVTFRVTSVKKGKSETALRTIQPLAYIPSLNLDTMLGIGLASPLRQRMLGQMIKTPRYSDPLPHNWVLAGGGRLLRIDKVDKRYDRDVDESKGYWGHSTRGYLHLLGHHLCLPVSACGLPAPATPEVDCGKRCEVCAKTCAYLPKATAPCDACRECGSCIGNESGDAQSVEVIRVAKEQKCQKTYSTMDSARKVWKKWEKAERGCSEKA